MKKSTKKYCDKIAELYGVHVIWVKGHGGCYYPGSNIICVGKSANDRMVISTFCHEMGHFLNFINQKYAKYHNASDFRRRFKTKNAAVRYALKAELYTDKVGRKFCKTWFPGVRYHAGYKDNKYFFDLLKKYLFGTYFA